MTVDFCASAYKLQLQSSTDILSCPKVPLPYVGDNENYIFISYSHKNYQMVYADLADMFDAGVRFWYDRGLPAGKTWNEEVLKKIKNPHCVGVLFYMSEELFSSQSANREMEITLNLTQEDNDYQRLPINHFSINLTNKSPAAILAACLQEGSLNMGQISILSQIFKDDATYINYFSVEHKSELISQIRTQFGVMNTENVLPIQIDYMPTSVYIGTLTEKLCNNDRLRLVADIQNILQEEGISSYVQQDSDGYSFCSGLDHSLKIYVQQQNQQKLNTAQHLLIITTMLGWCVCAEYFSEFNPEISTEKNIFYLIDDSCGSAEYFQKYYHLQERCTDNNILKRVFFLSDYQDRLTTAIKNIMKVK